MLNRRPALTLLESAGIFLFLAISYLAVDMFSGVFAVFYPEFALNNTLLFSLIANLFIYVPVIVYVLCARVDTKQVLRFNKIAIKHILLVIGITLTVYIIVHLVAILWTSLLAATGANLENDLISVLIENSPAWLIVLSIVVAAPIFEELSFRGAILSGYAAAKRTGAACIVTGLMFGLFHANLPQLLPAGVLGFFLAYIVLKTGSIFAGLIFHALNNLLAYTMVLDDYVLGLPWTLSLMPSTETPEGIGYYVVYQLVLSVVAGILLGFLIRALKKTAVPQNPPVSGTPGGKKYLIPLFIGIVVVLVRTALVAVVLYY